MLRLGDGGNVKIQSEPISPATFVSRRDNVAGVVNLRAAKNLEMCGARIEADGYGPTGSGGTVSMQSFGTDVVCPLPTCSNHISATGDKADGHIYFRSPATHPGATCDGISAPDPTAIVASAVADDHVAPCEPTMCACVNRLDLPPVGNELTVHGMSLDVVQSFYLNGDSCDPAVCPGPGCVEVLPKAACGSSVCTLLLPAVLPPASHLLGKYGAGNFCTSQTVN